MKSSRLRVFRLCTVVIVPVATVAALLVVASLNSHSQQEESAQAGEPGVTPFFEGESVADAQLIEDKPAIERSAAKPATFAERLSAAALERTTHQVRYDPAYVVLEYPGGDVPEDTGVCTDVVIRSYRALGFDLQKLVHEDMKANFSAYPKSWGLSRADKNIDHRRVPNLQAFFKRQGASLEVSDGAVDYRPGDLVAWDLNGRSLWHIGVVVEAPAGRDENKVWFVHNIGGGPVLDSDPFQWPIVGHYRWHPE